MLNLFTSTVLALSLALPLSAAPSRAPHATQRPVDLNTATVTELMQLPRVGQKTAERIITFRKQHGGFQRPEELMNVKGIGDKSYAKLKPFLAVSLARPAVSSHPAAKK